MAKSSTSFKPGRSGNPVGRQPGETARGRFRKQVEKALPGIVEQLVTAALAGDVQAARTILERVVPALRPTDERILLQLPEDADNLVAQGDAVLKAMSAGAITIDQAKNVMTVLSGQRALIEQVEVIQRLEVIEAWLQQRSEEGSGKQNAPGTRP